MSAVSEQRKLPEQVVTGKRLGRHINHDPRSRDFAVTPVTTLKSVRHTRHAPVFDQGDVGSCVGNASVGALCTSPFTHRYTEKRAVKVYSACETLDGDGPYPPNDNGSSGLTAAKVLLSQGLIASYRHCFNAQAVYTALQNGPVITGVSWLEGFDNPVDGHMVYSGQSRGGHEVCLDQIDVENQRVWITNSWGSGWGVEGRAYWTFADYAKILADYGDATVFNKV